ncbi:hypothetical protein K8P10_002844 [Leucobacter sp. Psy1]|nr:hypothetical protein K8P10_002844 [Leucobacter sp. Psy1]
MFLSVHRVLREILFGSLLVHVVHVEFADVPDERREVWIRRWPGAGNGPGRAKTRMSSREAVSVGMEVMRK